jgi:hypothetical protein
MAVTDRTAVSDLDAEADHKLEGTMRQLMTPKQTLAAAAARLTT